jgi:hypothetical protein
MTQQKNKKHIARSLALYQARRAGWLEGRPYQWIADSLGVDRTTAMRNMLDLENIEPLVEEYLKQLSPQIKTKAQE